MAGADMKRILILEDDEDLAEGIEMSLRDDDVEPVRCRLVAEAERLVWEKDFDLLILDINLPDGSGLELCRKVRDIQSSSCRPADGEGHGNGYRQRSGMWGG